MELLEIVGYLYQNAFFDVRVTNPDCDSQVNSSIPSILRKHELEKKREYNDRVMQAFNHPLPNFYSPNQLEKVNVHITRRVIAQAMANQFTFKHNENNTRFSWHILS